MQKIIAIITLIIALSLINYSIYKKEQLLENGKIVFLKLAPVDPRSLMQGDFMALRFELAGQIQVELKENKLFTDNFDNNKSTDGLVYVQLDKKDVASFVSIASTKENTQTSANGDNLDKVTALQFRVRKGQVKFATNAYFFEEGTGKTLQPAKYGKFRVSFDGELLLVTLHDENLKELG